MTNAPTPNDPDKCPTREFSMGRESIERLEMLREETGATSHTAGKEAL